MASTLKHKRKNELKNLASDLGLSTEGTREDLQERIKQHAAQHGALELHEHFREDSPDVASRRSSVSESGSRRSSRRMTGNLAGLSSQDEGGSRSNRTLVSQSKTDSDSEEPLPEHGVRSHLEKMQSGLQEVGAGLRASIDNLRRASIDMSETVSHASHPRRASQSSASAGSRKGSREEAAGGSGDPHRHQQKKHHRRRLSHGGGDDEDEGILARTWSELKHRCTNCATECRVSACFARCRKHAQEKGETLTECLSWLTNWNDFLRPFFAYYFALFLAPTLLSQIFNVDRAAARHHRKHEKEDHAVQQQQQHQQQHHHHHHQARPTGLLSKRTTSGLSFFVFKFALTHLLMHHFHAAAGSGVSPATAIGNVVAQAASAAAGGGHGHIGQQLHHHLHHLGHHHHFPYLSVQDFCQWLGEAFRHVPATVSLFTSGVGTVLALAEIIVTRR
ncbi:hypothetical protein DFQ26_008617 [Actinomortierella ambigua]|nr:hypothetical protein DFQ26_008617 [Actinomortierella ambigua]